MSLLQALGLEMTSLVKAGLAKPLQTPPLEVQARQRSNSDPGPGVTKDGATPDVDKARFEARWATSGPRVEAVRADIASNKHGTVPNGALNTAIADFEAADKRLLAANAAPDHVKALAALIAAEKALADFDAAFPAQNDQEKIAYLAARAKAQGAIVHLDAAVTAAKFGSPPQRFFASPIAEFVRGRGLMDKGETETNYLATAWRRVTPATSTDAVCRSSIRGVSRTRVRDRQPCASAWPDRSAAFGRRSRRRPGVLRRPRTLRHARPGLGEISTRGYELVIDHVVDLAAALAAEGAQAISLMEPRSAFFAAPASTRPLKPGWRSASACRARR